MKNAYETMGDPRAGNKSPQGRADLLKSSGDWLRTRGGETDTPLEYFYGRTWLEKDATAFDTLQIRAAMAYGLTPLSLDMIDFKVGKPATDPALGSVSGCRE